MIILLWKIKNGVRLISNTVFIIIVLTGLAFFLHQLQESEPLHADVRKLLLQDY